MNVLHKKKDRSDFYNHRGTALVAYAGKVGLKIVASQLGNYREAGGILPEEQCGFQPERSIADKLFVVHRLQAVRRGRKVPLCTCFIDLQKGYHSVDRELLWEVLTRFGVPTRCL